MESIEPGKAREMAKERLERWLKKEKSERPLHVHLGWMFSSQQPYVIEVWSVDRRQLDHVRHGLGKTCVNTVIMSSRAQFRRFVDAIIENASPNGARGEDFR